MATPSSSSSSAITSPSSSSSFSFRQINTFVFFDLEATGLNEIGNRPKVTELSMIAVGRNELLGMKQPPRVLNNLRLCFYPSKPITPEASKLTCLFNDALQDQSIFDANSTQLLNCFLIRLKKPVCLVAHNGNAYDFGLLQTELRIVQATLMLDLLCVDTMLAVKDLDNKRPSIMTTPTKSPQMIPVTPKKMRLRNDNNSSQTPDNSQLNEGVEKARTWLFSKGMGESVFLTPKSSPEKGNISDDKETSPCKKSKISYKLRDIYRREIGSEPVNAHCAETDSTMLMTIIVKRKDEFLPWMDKYSVPFSSVNLLYECYQR